MDFEAKMLDMAKPTFFLREISSIFFSFMGFYILVTQKNNFWNPRGSQWGLGGILTHFEARKCHFVAFFLKNSSFKTIEEHFFISNTRKPGRS